MAVKLISFHSLKTNVANGRQLPQLSDHSSGYRLIITGRQSATDPKTFQTMSEQRVKQ